MGLVSTGHDGTMPRACFQDFTMAQKIELVAMGQYFHVGESFFNALFETFTLQLDEIHEALGRCQTPQQRRDIMTTDNYADIDTLITMLLEQNKSSLEIQEQPAFMIFRKFIVQWMGPKTANFIAIMPNGAKLIADIWRAKDELNAQLRSHKDRLEAMRSTTEEKFDDLNTALETARSEIRTWRKKATETQSLKKSAKEVPLIKTQLVAAEAEIHDLKARFQVQEEDLTELKKNYDDIHEENVDLRLRLDNRENRVLSLKTLAKSQNNEVMKLQTQKQELIKTLQKCELSMERNHDIIVACMKRPREEEDQDDEGEDDRGDDRGDSGARKSQRSSEDDH